jgi:hypothetical protein
MDRDSKFSDAFRAFLDNEGVTPVRLPPRSPNVHNSRCANAGTCRRPRRPTEYNQHNLQFNISDTGLSPTFADELVCRLVKEGNTFVVTHVERLSAEDWQPDLNDLVFEPFVKAGRAEWNGHVQEE